MKNNSHSIRWLFLTPFMAFAMQVSAGPADDHGMANSLTEEGQCGHQEAGKLQYLQNSDQSNGYEVTVKTTEMQLGEKKENQELLNIKAGARKHLGCTLSDIMPLTSYTRVIVSETKSD